MQEEQEVEETDQKNNSGTQYIQRPLFSKIRNLNHFALTSFGSLFSVNTSSKPETLHQKYGRGSDSFPEFVAGLDQGPQHNNSLDQQADSLLDCTIQIREDSDEGLTPRAPDCYSPQAEDYYVARRPTHDRTIPNHQSIARKSPETAHTSTRFPEMRRFFSGISRSGPRSSQAPCNNNINNRYSTGDGRRASAYPESVISSAPLASTAVFPSSTSFDGSVFSMPSDSQLVSQLGHSGEFETPPLTPDSFNNQLLPSIAQPFDSLLDTSLASCRFSFQYGSSDTSDEFIGNRNRISEDSAIYTRRRLREIKEGKKPERIVNPNVNAESDTFNGADDPEEWYGLEYTLEVSSRERQPSETQSFCGGEHSKSRESWAAIHRGTIHPFFEDEDYRQWKNWHHFLDRQDEKKRHKKGYEFKSRSKHLAWFYVDEMRTRDILYWQKEVFGVVTRDVKERLQYIVERRPDPFHPPQKHNWSWYLKRSRSMACLRELEPRPPVVVDRRL